MGLSDGIMVGYGVVVGSCVGELDGRLEGF